MTSGGADGRDWSSVASLLQDGVVQVTGTGSAFAAIRIDKSVVAWGACGTGGDSSSVATLLPYGVVQVTEQQTTTTTTATTTTLTTTPPPPTTTTVVVITTAATTIANMLSQQ